MSTIRVAKADGELEPFAPEKLRASLVRAGAEADVSASIEGDIAKELYDGISTHEIYRRAFAHLRDHRRATAARYSLKRAILEFGPSGFPFEAYLSELFRREGWEADVDKIVKGGCVEHEVDVVAHKGAESLYVEAKFHNAAGFKTDLKVVLYVKARIDDIRAAGRETARGMVVTNTKFTSHAVRYATCQNLELLGWEYPAGATLHDRIHTAHLYPITALTTLSRSEKSALLSERIVLCSAVAMHEDALARAGVRKSRIDEVLRESGALCQSA